MEQLDLGSDDRPQRAGMLLSFVVIVEALKVEHVLVELRLRLLDPPLLGRDGLVPRLLHLLVLVAVVVSPSLLTVFRPGA